MDGIADILDAEAEQKVATYISNGESEIPSEGLKGAVGNKTWTVVVESGGDDDLKAQIAALKAQTAALGVRVGSLESHVDALLVPWVRNIAAQILLFFAGTQPSNAGPSQRYQKASGLFFDRIAGFTGMSDHWSADKFAVAADGVLSRRNSSIHPSSVSELDHLVLEANCILASIPNSSEFRKKLRHEVLIIEDYDDLKPFFCAQSGGTSTAGAAIVASQGTSSPDVQSGATGETS
jgi:hypothetical protein